MNTLNRGVDLFKGQTAARQRWRPFNSGWHCDFYVGGWLKTDNMQYAVDGVLWSLNSSTPPRVAAHNAVETTRRVKTIIS